MCIHNIEQPIRIDWVSVRIKKIVLFWFRQEMGNYSLSVHVLKYRILCYRLSKRLNFLLIPPKYI